MNSVYGQSALVLVNKEQPLYQLYASFQDERSIKAASILSEYVAKSTGIQLELTHKEIETNMIHIKSIPVSDLYPLDSYSIKIKDKNIYIKGSGRGVIYAAYRLVRDVIGAKKWSSGDRDTYIPNHTEIIVKSDYEVFTIPGFKYREAYYPAAMDQEYRDWYGLQSLEDLWGLWGHTFNKLVPASLYFKEHPEYFSYYNEKRQPTQLCLSNEDVYRITVDKLKQLMLDNAEATYWSISPNDDIGHCECDICQQLDKKEGGPQGSLIHFVNRIAKTFPDKKFTTLAYTYTANAPLHLQTAPNVYVMLSNIDSYKGYAIPQENSAKTFRRQLEQWQLKSKHIFVWDYSTQFTNYLIPFPVQGTLQKNLEYLKNKNVEGIFYQGSGDTYSDMAELNTYVLSHLLWDPNRSETDLVHEFVNGYYGAAAPIVEEYLDLRRKELETKNVPLSIYGNPVDYHLNYLSPAMIDTYSTLMDKAEHFAKGDTVLLDRIRRIRITQDYVYLQQARFFGLDKHGIFEQKNNAWEVRPHFKPKVTQFLQNAKLSGVNKLSEDGKTLDNYKSEWDSIFTKVVRKNIARGSEISFTEPFDPSIPLKGARTLVDGTPGYLDFSYNWLLWYGKPMIATVMLDTAQLVNNIEVDFLEDPRHWIFRPKFFRILVSEDGKQFDSVYEKEFAALDEDFDIRKINFTAAVGRKIRYIKVEAIPYERLPEWRYHPSKKITIACDEIWIN